MADAAASRASVFISYRREETAFAAGRLFDGLTEHFGPRQVFKDVDSIRAGDDFVDAISRAVGSCDVLLALIGKTWLTCTGDGGLRRLDDPADFVRLEIEAALTRGVRVIPILVDGARMPGADALPAALSALVRRHAVELSDTRYHDDLARLIEVLDPAPHGAADVTDRGFRRRVGTPADLGVRLVARLADSMLFFIPWSLLAPASGGSGSGSTTADTSVLTVPGAILLVAAVYEITLTALWGQTLGKRLLRIRVAAVEGGRAGWDRSSVRWSGVRATSNSYAKTARLFSSRKMR